MHGDKPTTRPSQPKPLRTKQYNVILIHAIDQQIFLESGSSHISINVRIIHVMQRKTENRIPKRQVLLLLQTAFLGIVNIKNQKDIWHSFRHNCQISQNFLRLDSTRSSIIATSVASIKVIFFKNKTWVMFKKTYGWWQFGIITAFMKGNKVSSFSNS